MKQCGLPSYSHHVCAWAPKLFQLRSYLHGTICREMGAVLNELWLDTNNFEGDLSVLGPTRLSYVTVHENPKLCK